MTLVEKTKKAASIMRKLTSKKKGENFRQQKDRVYDSTLDYLENLGEEDDDY